MATSQLAWIPNSYTFRLASWHEVQNYGIADPPSRHIAEPLTWCMAVSPHRWIVGLLHGCMAESLNGSMTVSMNCWIAGSLYRSSTWSLDCWIFGLMILNSEFINNWIGLIKSYPGQGNTLGSGRNVSDAWVMSECKCECLLHDANAQHNAHMADASQTEISRQRIFRRLKISGFRGVIRPIKVWSLRVHGNIVTWLSWVQ